MHDIRVRKYILKAQNEFELVKRESNDQATEFCSLGSSVFILRPIV